MKTQMTDGGSTGGGGRGEDEGTTNGGMTTEQMAGMEDPDNESDEDNADIDSNTLGGTSDSGAGPVGDGGPANRKG